MSTENKQVVDIENRRDRWRFTCPNGHRSWEPTNHHFWCQRCARHREVDGVFYDLRDRKTGELLDRDKVRLKAGVENYHGGIGQVVDDE
ncbi:hypothetical protein [Halohasta litorea]|uniref:Uncharacterized protein n=1 Tax=Halohasta litorea TaxID=869891 RepID=A0ABD6D846_9EURY|nr:hypothetical protein [Halohasta litorea]